MNKEKIIKTAVLIIAVLGMATGFFINRQESKYQPPKLITSHNSQNWDTPKPSPTPTPAPKGNPQNNYNTLAVTHKGSIYIAHRNRIYCFDGQKAYVDRTIGANISQLISYDGYLMYNAGGRLWLASDQRYIHNVKGPDIKMYDAKITVQNDLINIKKSDGEYTRYIELSSTDKNMYRQIGRQLPEDDRNIITDIDKQKFRIVQNKDSGNTHITLLDNGEKVIGLEGIANSPQGCIVTDSYVFYISSFKTSDGKAALFQYDKKGEKGIFAPVDISGKAEFINYDSEYVYIKDSDGNAYFKIDQQTLECTKLPVPYDDGVDHGIIDGWMYRLTYNNPTRINLTTGEIQPLTDILNEAIPKDPADGEPSKIEYFAVNLENTRPSKYYKQEDGWLMHYIGSEGEEWLEGGEEVCFQTSHDTAMDLGSAFDRKYMYAQDYYHPSSTGYNDIPEGQIVAAYNGKGNVFPVKVTYIDYLNDSRKPKQEWINYFRNWLEDEVGITDTPMVISESWSYTYNGKNIHIVNATNLIREDENIKVTGQVPYGENLVAYNLTAIFADGEKTGRAFDNYWLKASKEPINIDKGIYTSVITPTSDRENINEYAISAFSFYQQDENGNLLPCNFYSIGWTNDSWTGWIQDMYDVSVADFDFDGQVETGLILARASLYSSTEIFMPHSGKMYYGDD